MTLPGHLEPQAVRRALGGVVSVALHVGLYLILMYSGGRHEGIGLSEAAPTRLVLLEAREADERDGRELSLLEPSIAALSVAELPQPRIELPATPTSLEPTDALADVQIEHPAEVPALAGTLTNTAIHAAARIAASPAEKSSVERRLTQLAETLASQPQAHLDWQQDGTHYSAVLIPSRASDGTSLDRVIAEVSAADHGRQRSTRVILKRLAFSQFTQMVDRWDPMVQLHDDVIVGRFHSNSRFKVLHEAGTGPKFLGKVTTAAQSYDMEARGVRHKTDIFAGGVEMQAGHINLPEELAPSHWVPPQANARVHELPEDTRIRFFGDGSYMWQAHGASRSEYLNAPVEHPIYFIAAAGTTLYVKGVVAGKILVYSPHRIVIEGNLTYARDPREDRDSRDYLGLVSDRYIEVASPGITGPGDLEIDGAILAGRRFVVRDIEHPRAATLKIFGSLAAGTLSASEPRYATKIEYDARFEQRRPPGFPSTNRYEVEDWDGHWTESRQKEAPGIEVPERYADDAL